MQRGDKVLGNKYLHHQKIPDIPWLLNLEAEDDRTEKPEGKL